MNVYILYSESLTRYYTGISAYHGKRTRQHKSGQNSWTSRAGDWELVWKHEVPNSIEARMLEKKIKGRGARRYLIDRGVATPPEAGQGSSLPR